MGELKPEPVYVAGHVGRFEQETRATGVRFRPSLSYLDHSLMDVALEAGAEDIVTDDDTFTVKTDPSSFEAVKKACDDNGLTYLEAEISMIPQNTVRLDDDQAGKMLKLMDALEDHDDVQNVYANFDIDTETMEKLL